MYAGSGFAPVDTRPLCGSSGVLGMLIIRTMVGRLAHSWRTPAERHEHAALTKTRGSSTSQCFSAWSGRDPVSLEVLLELAYGHDDAPADPDHAEVSEDAPFERVAAYADGCGCLVHA